MSIAITVRARTTSVIHPRGPLRRVVCCPRATCHLQNHQDPLGEDVIVTGETFVAKGRRALLTCLAIVAAPIALVIDDAEAADFQCRGLRARELQVCLREKRLGQEEEGEDEGESNREDRVLKNRQYEQPGTLVVTPQGVQYREIDEGYPNGRQCRPGLVCEVPLSTSSCHPVSRSFPCHLHALQSVDSTAFSKFVKSAMNREYIVPDAVHIDYRS
jgi:hypothetical protein